MSAEAIDSTPNSPAEKMYNVVKQEKDDGDNHPKSSASTPDAVDVPCAMPAQHMPTDSKSNADGGMRVTLEEHLWYQFSNLVTEMIITRIGRRMFPGITVSVCGLDEKTKYAVTLEVHSADGDRYKFVNGTWIVAGKGDAHNTDMMRYVHPDSPATGKQWMGAPISFKKLKLTNNKKSKKDYIILNSMHKYQPRVVISQLDSQGQLTVVHTHELPECQFVAVTAYQNDQVTQLKIDHNPFAKAFRDTSPEYDMSVYCGIAPTGMEEVWTHPPPVMASPYSQPYQQSEPYQEPVPSVSAALPSHMPAVSHSSSSEETPPYSPPSYKSSWTSYGEYASIPAPALLANHHQSQCVWNPAVVHEQSPPLSPPDPPLYIGYPNHPGQDLNGYTAHASSPTELQFAPPSTLLPPISHRCFSDASLGYGGRFAARFGPHTLPILPPASCNISPELLSRPFTQ